MVVVVSGVKVRGLPSQLQQLEKQYNVQNCTLHLNRREQLGGIRMCDNGWDANVRDRLQKEEMWPILLEVAMGIFKSFRLLVVSCENGRCRSLALAFQVAVEMDALLVCLHEPDVATPNSDYASVKYPRILGDINQLLGYVHFRMVTHEQLFSQQIHPFLGLGIKCSIIQRGEERIVDEICNVVILRCCDCPNCMSKEATGLITVSQVGHCQVEWVRASSIFPIKTVRLGGKFEVLVDCLLGRK